MSVEKLCFGVDVGGTKTAVCAGLERADGMEILDRAAFATTPHEPEPTLQKLLALLGKLKNTHGAPAAVGVSCGGPLDAAAGRIYAPPNLPGWDGVGITGRITAHLGVPAALENDADAGALAEHRYGAGRGADSMIFLTFGTGLGAGLILNGALYRGASGMAGEAGHIRLAPGGPVGYYKAGSFEGFCSGGGLRQLGQMEIERRLAQGGAAPWVRAHAGGGGPSARELAEAARAGDAAALAVFELCGTRFGEGLSVLIDLLNPQRIVAGSIFARCEDLLRPAMERAIAREALAPSARACQVVPAQLGEQIGDYAALSVAFACAAAESRGKGA